MALGTVVVKSQSDQGAFNLIIADVQLTAGANYTTGGEAFDVAQIPGASGRLLAVIPTGSVGSASAVPVWDAANKKLMAFGTAGSASGLTQIAGNTDLSGQTARVICLVSGIG